jgi:hypothetical protein
MSACNPTYFIPGEAVVNVDVLNVKVVSSMPLRFIFKSVGASLTALTVIATVSVAEEKAVEEPLELASTLAPFDPEV